MIQKMKSEMYVTYYKNTQNIGNIQILNIPVLNDFTD